jgi:8-oxo-dGTP pyrophosphatase MutT (NUDIX family)
MEETGFRIRNPRKLFEAYMSPGSVTEKLHFFAAEYEAADRVAQGGGHEHEGEDIEVLEMTLPEALEQGVSEFLCVRRDCLPTVLGKRISS